MVVTDDLHFDDPRGASRRRGVVLNTAFLRVPAADATGRSTGTEHTPHIGHGRRVPGTDIAREGTAAFEHSLHCRHGRSIPREELLIEIMLNVFFVIFRIFVRPRRRTP